MTTLDLIQQRLEGALRSASGADDRELAARLRDEGHRLVLLMNGLVRATRLYSLDNQALEAPAQELTEVLSGLLESLGVVHVVFVEDQAYVNDVRLRLRPSEQPAVDQLVADLGRHDVGGLSFHQSLDPQQWKRVAHALGTPSEGPGPASALLERLQDVGDIDVSGRCRFRMSDEDRPGTKRHDEVLERAKSVLAEALGGLAGGRMPNPLPLRRVVIDLVESLTARPDRAATAPFAGASPLGAGERHLLSVCQLSIMLGHALGLSKAVLSDLGVAAIYHDVGYLRAQTRESHALTGVRLLVRQRGFSEAKVRRLLTVLEHHAAYLDMSNHDHSPFLFARILRVAEDYDLLVAARPGQGAPMPPSQALATMWAGRGASYDPMLLALFAQALGQNPPGTLLELSDGRWAVAVGGGRDRERFASPVVRVVREADGAPSVAGQSLDLYEQRAELEVRRVVEPAEVTPEISAASRVALVEAAA